MCSLTTTQTPWEVRSIRVALLGGLVCGMCNVVAAAAAAVEFVTKTMTVDDEQVKAQIWDTAGQERYSSMMGTYYRKAKGALLLFSVADRASYDDVDGWRDQVKTRTS